MITYPCANCEELKAKVAELEAKLTNLSAHTLPTNGPFYMVKAEPIDEPNTYFWGI